MDPLELGNRLAAAQARALAPSPVAAAKLAAADKLYVRDRIDALFDPGTFIEDGRLANAQAEGLPADGVITGRGLVNGRAALVVANDPSVKAGSWGARTVEKIIRMTEIALRDELPIFWFIDSAGARITDQVDLFPGRRGAGRIFANQVALSGKVPQICCLFGPSAAGGAYIPSFCDIVIMVEGNASMYLGSPRMAEMVVGERVSLEEMGGARMHAEVSGCGDQLAADDLDAIEQAKAYFGYLPDNWRSDPPRYDATPPSREFTDDLVPADEARGYDIGTVIEALVDEGSFWEVKPLFAPELVTGFALLDGNPVGIVANQPAVKGGVLVRRLGGQGGPIHLAVRRFQCPLALPGRRAGVHDRQCRGTAGHHPPRCEDDHGRGGGHGADDLGDHPQGVRCGSVRDGRSRLRTRRLSRAADRQDRRDGAGGGDQRGVREQDRGSGRGRTRPVRGARSAPRTRKTSTSCTWPANWSSTTWWNRADLRGQLIARFAAAAGKDRHFSTRRHGVPPV